MVDRRYRLYIQAVFVVERSGLELRLGVGVASPKTKSNKQPRVDSSDMDGGLETGKCREEVRKWEWGRARVWRMLPPTLDKVTVKARTRRPMWRKRARIMWWGVIAFWAWDGG